MMKASSGKDVAKRQHCYIINGNIHCYYIYGKCTKISPKFKLVLLYGCTVPPLAMYLLHLLKKMFILFKTILLDF